MSGIGAPAGGIKSIQAFSITPTTSGATAVITAVNTAKSIINLQGYKQSFGTESGGYGCTVVLTDSTTVTATNVTNSGTNLVKGVVVEYN